MLAGDETNYFKHTLLAKAKKFFKETFAKGPTELSIKIFDEVIFMQLSGILRNSEFKLLQEQPFSAILISSYRKALFDCNKPELVCEVETIINRKVLNISFDQNIDLDQAICLLVLDRPV